MLSGDWRNMWTRKDKKETPTRIEVSTWQIGIQPVRMGIWSIQCWRSDFKCRCFKVPKAKKHDDIPRNKHISFPGIFHQDLVPIGRVKMGHATNVGKATENWRLNRYQFNVLNHTCIEIYTYMYIQSIIGLISMEMSHNNFGGFHGREITHFCATPVHLAQV